PPTEPRTGADGPQWASVAGVGLSMWPAAHRQRSVLRKPGLRLTHLGGQGGTPQPSGPRADLGGHARRRRAVAGAHAGCGAPRRLAVGPAVRQGPYRGGAGGWVASVAPGRTEQPLAPDTGERGWGVAEAALYRSPV